MDLPSSVIYELLLAAMAGGVFGAMIRINTPHTLGVRLISLKIGLNCTLAIPQAQSSTEMEGRH